MGSFEFRSKVVSAESKLAAWNAAAFFNQSSCSSEITRPVNCFNVLSNLGLNELMSFYSSVSAEFSEEGAAFFFFSTSWAVACNWGWKEGAPFRKLCLGSRIHWDLSRLKRMQGGRRGRHWISQIGVKYESWEEQMLFFHWVCWGSPFRLRRASVKGLGLHAYFHAPAFHLRWVHLPAIPSLSTLGEGRDEDLEWSSPRPLSTPLIPHGTEMWWTVRSASTEEEPGPACTTYCYHFRGLGIQAWGPQTSNSLELF